MRRPTRTARLSIAAAFSVASLVIVAFFDIHSYFHWDAWQIGNHWRISLFHGTAFFYRESNVPKQGFLAGMDLLIPLFVLLIAPVWWLSARPANLPAFPVITDAKQV